MFLISWKNQTEGATSLRLAVFQARSNGSCHDTWSHDHHVTNNRGGLYCQLKASNKSAAELPSNVK